MQTTPQLPFRILTHNIRFAATSFFKGEQPWTDRRQPLINELLYNTRNLDSFICLQEVLHPQLIDVLSGLNHSLQKRDQHEHLEQQNQEWTYIGVGRDDGQQAGEYSPIIYRPAIWQLRHWETVWLSQTPSIPSKGWDASSIRIVTIGIFTHRASGHTVLTMNTHLDDQGSLARFEGAHMILNKIRDYEQSDWSRLVSGVFLTGDLNSEEHQEAYRVLAAADSSLKDTARLVDAKEHYGDRFTWTGFGYESESPSRLDYIFLGLSPTGRQPWTVQGSAVLPNRFEDGLYNSDHRAVVTDVVLT